MQAYLVKISAQLLKKALRSTDERSKLEGELMNGMDVVKCSAWEVRINDECIHKPHAYSFHQSSVSIATLITV